jgi:nitrate/TMAO reductase-like tetraheme cytochrome c subunit
MRRIFSWLRSLPRPIAWIVVVGAVLFLMAFAVVASATAWEYTNSPEFCGETCHTMPPEYTAYKVSPHARVDCVDCHLGQEHFRDAVPAKAKEVTHVVNALFNTYEPPIYIRNLRPARDTCERCHNPDKFSFDTFVNFRNFAEDEENSATRNYMTFKTGGGTREQGLGRGIHWHVENEVWYYTNDPLKQTIPYIKEIGPSGEVVEYFDVEAGLPPDFGKEVAGELRRMDCIDCHNRISHLFRSPQEAMDRALDLEQIDPDIPYIKKKGVEILAGNYASAEEGYQAIDSLDQWYQDNYPDYHAQNQATMAEAITAMKDIFDVTIFPNMSVGWETHPDNSQHKEFPGCFRCHDGKHTSREGVTVRLECNICHSIPEEVAPGQEAPVISLDRPFEPESHKDSNWLAQHRYVFDETCAECHTVTNPGGTDNSSFCSNSACHATEWKFVGLNAPAIRELSQPPSVPGSGEPRPVPHPVGSETDCTLCHGPEGVRPYPESHAGFSQEMCTQCHETSLSESAPTDQEAEAGEVIEAGEATATPEPGASEAEEAPEEQPSEAATAGGPPAVPHALEGRDDCLACHGENGFKPYPADHAGRPNETCLGCHQPETPAESTSEPTAEPTAAPTTAPVTEPEPTTAPTESPVTEPEATPQEAEEEPEAEEEAAVPGIPHPVEGREDQCLACHYTGSIEPFPADHEGRTNDSCVMCHQMES